MINNTLPINSLKNKTIELFQKEMIEDIIINNQLNCKCLLIMDNISSNLISKYMSFSEIINSGIFSIDSIYKKRKPYKSFGAIYLISSNENTIKLVLNDFKSEKKRLYKWCFLFSINKIRDNIIELLLNKKFIRRIKALKEINISYIPLDKNLFYFGPKKNYNSLYHLFTNENNNKTINKIDIEKICSICKVTKTYPNIIYFIHDPICKILAIKINKKLKKYFEKIKIEKNGILLLISRKLDIISPIQFDLTYGHLLFELYKNYNKKEENAIKINLEGKDQNIIFNYNDVLYEKYKVMDLSQLMINLNKDIELFMQSDMAKLEKRENLNIEEMNTAVKNISEYKYLSPLYSRHLKIVEDINKKSIERNIMKIIDLQSTIISGANYKGKKKGANHILKKITENKNNFKKNDFMRLLCIIKYYNKESDINNLINIIESDLIKFNDNEKNIINFFSIENTKINEEILKNFDKYIILHRNKYKYNTQEEIENKKDKRYLCIKESKITTICDMLSKNEIPKDLFEYLEPPSNNINYENIKINIFNENNIKKDDKEKQNLIIYNIGGMSNYEISSLEKSNEIGQFNFNIIYGSNNIYNYEEYFNEIKEYLEGKNGIINENENEEELNINNELEELEVKEEKKEEKRQKRKYKEDINKKEENEFDDNNNINIEMKEIKSDEKEEKKDYNNIETNKDKITKKKKNKKKKIEMNNINNDSLKEPLNSEDDLR
jgi:hypothetical protein